MKQRLAIARGLLNDPRVLFMDEPTRSLDPGAAQNARNFISNYIVQEQGKTVFLSTHNLSEAEQLCSRIAILDEGNIKIEGSPSELKSDLGNDSALSDVFSSYTGKGFEEEKLPNSSFMKERRFRRGGRIWRNEEARNVIFRKAFSFIKRSYMLQMSYKLESILRLFFMLFNILTYYFVAKLVGTTGEKYLEPYGGDYFSFVLIGIAFSTYLMVSLRGFSETIRDEQMMGTLEAMLVTPTNTATVITFSSLWSFIFASIRVLLYLAVGILLGVNMTNANLIGAFIILILTILCFSSLGILAASFIMIFKRGDPINMMFMSTSELFGGVFFPIEVLPWWLQSISHLFPMTYSLSGMRHALLQGYSLQDLAPEISTLVIFSLILLPLKSIHHPIRSNKS